MNFGEALAELKMGVRAQREGWNGKGMWIKLVKPEDGLQPYIMMLTASGKLQPGWLASQEDMLAEDWRTV